MNPLDVLAPNQLGILTENFGLEELVQNRGLGVEEVSPTNQQAAAQKSELSNPEMAKDRLRTAAARQFGKTKKEVGF